MYESAPTFCHVFSRPYYILSFFWTFCIVGFEISVREVPKYPIFRVPLRHGKIAQNRPNPPKSLNQQLISSFPKNLAYQSCSIFFWSFFTQKSKHVFFFREELIFHRDRALLVWKWPKSPKSPRPNTFEWYRTKKNVVFSLWKIDVFLMSHRELPKIGNWSKKWFSGPLWSKHRYSRRLLSGNGPVRRHARDKAWKVPGPVGE